MQSLNQLTHTHDALLKKTCQLDVEVRCQMTEENFVGKYLNSRCDALALSKTVLCYTIIFGLAAHLYAFANFTVSHDSLAILHALDAGKICLGRFGVVAYKFLTSSFVTLPWISGVFALLFLGISNILICRIFQLERIWQIILISGVLTTNITMTSLISTYMHDLGADAFALLMSVLAAYAWHGYYRHSLKRATCIILGVFSLVTALSIYQSYLSVTMIIILFVLLLDLLEGKKFSPIMKSGLLAVACILASCLIYLGLALAAGHVSGLGLNASSYNSLSNISNASITLQTRIYVAYVNLLNAFLLSPITTFRYPMVSLIHGFLLCYVFFMGMKRWWKIGVGEKVLTAILVVVTPFVMNISGFLDGMSHDLMIYALWLIYIPMIVLGTKQKDGEAMLWKKRGRMVALALIALVIISNIQTANTVYVKKDAERQATLSRVTSMLNLLEQQEEYSYGETSVALLGYPLADEELVLEEGNVGALTGSKSSDQITYSAVWRSYLANVLNYKINLCSDEQSARFQDCSEVKEMPCFPNKGGIKMIDGVMVVKFSEELQDNS